MAQQLSIPRFLQSPSDIQQPLAWEQVQTQPGRVQWAIRRFARPAHWMGEEAGLLRYELKGESGGGEIELRFCLSGQMYCGRQGAACETCPGACNGKVESLDLFSFVFTEPVLSAFVRPGSSVSNMSDALLRLQHPVSFVRTIPVCNKTRLALDSLLQPPYRGASEEVYANAQAQMLLLYGLDCLAGEQEIGLVTCKFLANGADRDKVLRAREILLEHIGSPITIKELSRKVAMNECYLKKGFKEMFGSTIFDFYQTQRMEHARYLLYEKGLSVTEVSYMLGYSSISHFSTAFKKHTGLKPCELLFR